MMAMFVVLVVRDQNATNAIELLVLNLIYLFITLFNVTELPMIKRKKT